MAKSSKGSAFERQICKDLSSWWTGGKRDDVFWRTGGSGGRAKTRGRTGKGTYGQHGDICASDPIGDMLIDALTIELKRGYSRSSIVDLLDKKSYSAQQEWEKWYVQAEESHTQAGSFSWLIIHQRDKRAAVVYYPDDLDLALSRVGAFPKTGAFYSPLIGAQFTIKTGKKNSWKRATIYATTLDYFLANVTPKMVKRLSEGM